MKISFYSLQGRQTGSRNPGAQEGTHCKFIEIIIQEKADFHQHTVAWIASWLCTGATGPRAGVHSAAKGNENSWEAVESRTARRSSETDEEAGWFLQG